MRKGSKSDDSDQLRLDLEDALARLAGLAGAVAEVEKWAEEVRKLQSLLRHAKRKLKEAGWNRDLLISQSRGK